MDGEGTKWMNEWIEWWVNGLISEWMYECIDEEGLNWRINEWTNILMVGLIDC